jgi:butyrate kinase
LLIAYELCAEKDILAITMDTPVTDEFEPLARYSGLPQISRKSSFHVLNQKGVARKYAEKTGRAREDLNLIVIHMGGGISVAAHKKGRLVDANNALDGDGPFSTNRTGSLPVGDLVDMCYSGQYSHDEMKTLINGKGGMMAYLGENDIASVQKRALKGDGRCAEALDAMIYQTAKEAGACAVVLEGRVDAIVVTGGIANSKYLMDSLRERIGFIAPVEVFPGEFEMECLAWGAYQALRGAEPIQKM